jgi:uracil-DNA glycosylase
VSDIIAIRRHQGRLKRCERCPKMTGPPVTGAPVPSRVMLIGQAPGVKETVVHRPFAWTAGRTLFGWFERIGLAEEAFRARVYMAAVCRCFPGKNPQGGDRVPDRQEISNCRPWLERELDLLEPDLILPVGKLAVAQFMPVARLEDVIGARHRLRIGDRDVDTVPLPHPSGASTWHRTDPGRGLLEKALRVVRRHPAWKELLQGTE